MRALLSLVTVVTLVAPHPLAAQSMIDNAPPIRAASRLKIPALPALAPTAGQAATTNKAARSWPGRHPVVFGMLVGAGAGAVVGAASLPEDRNPDVGREIMASMGATWGAGFGALAGFIVGQVRK